MRYRDGRDAALRRPDSAGISASRDYDTMVAIVRIAVIFRALCRSPLPEAKQRKRWRNDSKSPRAGRYCELNPPVDTCFRPRMRSGNANRPRPYWSIALTLRGLKPIYRSVRRPRPVWHSHLVTLFSREYRALRFARSFSRDCGIRMTEAWASLSLWEQP